MPYDSGVKLAADIMSEFEVELVPNMKVYASFVW
jgi:hypothetical protein